MKTSSSSERSKGNGITTTTTEAHPSYTGKPTQDPQPSSSSSTSSFRTFASLKDADFRLFWAASMAQMAGMNMQMMVRTWYMYFLTERATMVGAVSLASALPMLFLSPIGGIIADRIQKRHMLTAGQAASGALGLAIAVAVQTEIITPTYLLVAAVIQGTIMGLMMPSRQAIIPEIVGRDRLMNAISLNMAGQNINRLVAPAVAGILIEQIGVASVYFTLTGLFFIAVFFTLFLHTKSFSSPSPKGAWSDLKEGVIYIRQNKTILGILTLALISAVLSMPLHFLLPVFTEEILQVGAQELGFLWSALGLGAIFGSLGVASLGNRNRGMMMLVFTLGLGIALVAFSSSTWYTVSLFLMIPVGLGHAGRMALSNALTQAYTDDEHRGRVMSVYMMEFGVMSIATFGAAALAEIIGIQLAIGGMAALMVFVVIFYVAFVPRIRRLS